MTVKVSLCQREVWRECKYSCGVSAQKNRAIGFDCSIFEVRIKGLEPPRLSASDPKSDVATNYTISARNELQRYAKIFIKARKFANLYLVSAKSVKVTKLGEHFF